MFVKNADEVDEYMGGIFREAGDHPEIGPKVRAVNLVMRLRLTDLDGELTVAFREGSQVIFGPTGLNPALILLMPTGTADHFLDAEVAAE
ncbi:MAG TPA: hypothetical protein VFB19_03740 [Mycobacterium sp.]|nr:hypothetical protein [Mycobacterium sp.]